MRRSERHSGSSKTCLNDAAPKDMIGETVSHYTILEKLGAGGMGVVYRARDTKLDRDVALKFLPPEFTLDPDAKERFIHEAKAASALQHHNICTVHDIDQEDGQRLFIVMDCYDGETLKTRISKSRMRSEEAVEIAIQIAQGLAKAHQGGIIHRDIKPANIVITSDGVVKILDFGLAKLSTATKLTKTGSTLGTVAYMAPEQLQGGSADARADIFSLGVVLYEMLSGRLPFRGEHEAALMYAIMNEEPEPLQTLKPEVSTELLHIVGRALEKDPADRYVSMEDLLVDLRRARKESSRVSMTALTSRRRTRSSLRLRWVVVPVVLVAIIAVSYILTRPRALPELNPHSKLRTVQVSLKDIGANVILSPDGNWIALSGTEDGLTWDVYYTNAAGGLVKRVTFDSSQFADADDYSNDGAWLLYSRRHRGKREIAVVPSLGGPSRVVTSEGRWGKFLPGTDRVTYLKGGYIDRPNVGNRFELWSVKTDGTDRRLEYAEEGSAGRAGHVTVAYSLSPNGRRVAWLKTYPDFAQDIITIDLTSHEEQRITFTRSPKGNLVWTRDDQIVYADFSGGNYDLWMCPAEGGPPLQLTRSRHDEITGTLCDDASKLLYYEEDNSNNLQMIDLTSFEQTALTFDDQNRTLMTSSPDGRYVAMSLTPSFASWLTFRGITIQDVLGKDPLRTICKDDLAFGKAWSPDGRWIAYSAAPDTAGGPNKICIVSPMEETPSRVLQHVAGLPAEDHGLRWTGADTLSWFAAMKTWVCPINDPHPVQFYEDSTRARTIQGGRYILYLDHRSGRQGWWVDLAPGTGANGELVNRRRLPSTPLAIDHDGKWFYGSTQPGQLDRVSIPDWKSVTLPVKLSRTDGQYVISQDGRRLFCASQLIISKLMLWENPFLPK